MITDIIRLTQLNNYYKENYIIEIAKGKYELISFKNLFKKLKQKFK